MSKVTRIAIAGMVLGCVGLAGCVVEPYPRHRYYREGVVVEPAPPPVVVEPGPPVIVDEAPPPPIFEVVPPPPEVGIVWVPGYWGWFGGRHFWYKGHYEHPPHPGGLWMAPHWENRGGHYHLQPGHWR